MLYIVPVTSTSPPQGAGDVKSILSRITS